MTDDNTEVENLKGALTASREKSETVESVSDPNVDGLIDHINETDPEEYKHGIDPTQTFSRTSVDPSQLLQDTPYFTILGILGKK